MTSTPTATTSVILSSTNTNISLTAYTPRLPLL
jgi:hypothetical protein